eukprot:gb/GFBE01052631.1/.p1 GENE.gb/GFBE01052631.1/~~gb/GFBE01052631.1/.p1  ORF type:complete len:423 (+),score=47.00 gb/GFBE01052631.1/:1-1269(+)
MGSCASVQVPGEDFGSFYSRYNLLECIQEGTFASIFAAENKVNKDRLAVKVRTGNRSNVSRIECEAEAWTRIGPHKNVVYLVGCFQEASSYFMVMERCQGSLFRKIADHPQWSYQQLVTDFSGILHGIRHLHSCSVVHRDINQENILYGGQDGQTVKIADYDLAVHLESTATTLFEEVGSLTYMAPEMLSGRGYTFSVDMWAFGVLCYTVVVGQCPIGKAHQSPAEVAEDIVSIIGVPQKLRQQIEDLESAIRRQEATSESTFSEVIPRGGEVDDSADPRVLRARLAVFLFMQKSLQSCPLSRATALSALSLPLISEPIPEDTQLLPIVNRVPWNYTQANTLRRVGVQKRRAKSRTQKADKFADCKPLPRQHMKERSRPELRKVVENLSSLENIRGERVVSSTASVSTPRAIVHGLPGIPHT